jgi:hypothetical protein
MGKTWTLVHPGVEKTKINVATALNLAGEDGDTKVFTLHVSGNVVYAVAGSGGC